MPETTTATDRSDAERQHSPQSAFERAIDAARNVLASPEAGYTQKLAALSEARAASFDTVPGRAEEERLQADVAAALARLREGHRKALEERLPAIVPDVRVHIGKQDSPVPKHISPQRPEVDERRRRKELSLSVSRMRDTLREQTKRRATPNEIFKAWQGHDALYNALTKECTQEMKGIAVAYLSSDDTFSAALRGLARAIRERGGRSGNRDMRALATLGEDQLVQELQTFARNRSETTPFHEEAVEGLIGHAFPPEEFPANYGMALANWNNAPAQVHLKITDAHGEPHHVIYHGAWAQLPEDHEAKTSVRRFCEGGGSIEQAVLREHAHVCRLMQDLIPGMEVHTVAKDGSSLVFRAHEEPEQEEMISVQSHEGEWHGSVRDAECNRFISMIHGELVLRVRQDSANVSPSGHGPDTQEAQPTSREAATASQRSRKRRK